MIIDFHNHPDWHGHDLESFIANMDRYNIDKTLILSWEAPVDEYDPASTNCFPSIGNRPPISFERCVSYIERAPERFIPGYAPDPRDPFSIDKLRSAVSIYGVRAYGELKLRMMYDNPDAIRMFRVCGELGLPVTIHIDYEFERGSGYPRPNYWYGGGIEAFGRALLLCPETIFLGHAPGFWAHISGDDQFDKTAYPKGPVLPGGRLVELMLKHPNLYCDISAGSGHNALNRDRDFTKTFLTDFQDRVLYGRDYFDNIHQELLNSLDLASEILDKIYYRNALKLIP
jgi:predicted TIM-barrel fold metal-dependent hydrolase